MSVAGCAGSAAPRAGIETAPTAMHATPSRQEVMDAMSAVAPAVHACGDGQGGALTVQIDVANDGTVASARVLAPGTVAVVPEREVRGTAIEPCVIAAVRAARLPAFSRESFTFSFPFHLR